MQIYNFLQNVTKKKKKTITFMHAKKRTLNFQNVDFCKCYYNLKICENILYTKLFVKSDKRQTKN